MGGGSWIERPGLEDGPQPVFDGKAYPGGEDLGVGPEARGAAR